MLFYSSSRANVHDSKCIHIIMIKVYHSFSSRVHVRDSKCIHIVTRCIIAVLVDTMTFKVYPLSVFRHFYDDTQQCISTTVSQSES